MTGLVKTGALTASPQVVNIAANMAPTTVTLNSVAAGRKIRLSASRSGDASTFFEPTVDGTATGSVSCAILSPMCWVEFTGTVGDTYEVV